MEYSDILSVIGNAVRKERRHRLWTQERLAEMSHVDRSFLSKIERGEVNVSVLTLCEIAKALNVSIIELFANNGK